MAITNLLISYSISSGYSSPIKVNASCDEYPYSPDEEIVEAVKTISEFAGRLALDETGDWFDGVTVKKDVKEISDSVKLFEKTVY